MFCQHIERNEKRKVTCALAGQRAKFAKNIRKQIMQVRRKLSMQKRKMEAADSKSPDAGKSSKL